MNKIFCCLILFVVVGCKDKKHAPDISGVTVNVKIERFDRAFFAADTNHIEQSLFDLNRQFPYFFTDFTANILGIGVLSDTAKTGFFATRQFLTSYLPVKDAIEQKFANTNKLQDELRTSLRYVKYYFPKYPIPQKVVTFIGPFDAPGVAITSYALAIGLQLYAGKNFTFYTSMQGQELYPSYISRRFEPEYITPNCMKAIAEDLFPDKSSSKPLIGQMIEKGKYWWLISHFLPDTPDSLITGFTAQQLEWCRKNEGLAWNYFVQGAGNELYSIDPDIIKNYIGDAPTTSGMPESSPGNIGQWLGWQIVKKYAEDHPSIGIVDLMKTDPKQLFEDSKYKPR